MGLPQCWARGENTALTLVLYCLLHIVCALFVIPLRRSFVLARHGATSASVVELVIQDHQCIYSTSDELHTTATAVCPFASIGEPVCNATLTSSVDRQQLSMSVNVPRLSTSAAVEQQTQNSHVPQAIQYMARVLTVITRCCIQGSKEETCLSKKLHCLQHSPGKTKSCDDTEHLMNQMV